MKIHELIAREGACISFEFFPPKTEEGEDQLFEVITRLETLHPGYVSVTYGAGGSTARNTHRIIKRIRDTTSITPMPHLTCMQQSKSDLRKILMEYRDDGIENILALRGDLLKIVR
jgi:methylenetetrahydrofolate reductase (NADPH)